MTMHVVLWIAGFLALASVTDPMLTIPAGVAILLAEGQLWASNV